MQRSILPVLAFLLASCGASDVGSDAAPQLAEVEAVNPIACVISDVHIENLRTQFRSFASDFPNKIKSGKEQNRASIEYPFLEPPTVSLTIYENPNELDYAWKVKSAEGCKKDGSNFDYVKFEMTFRDDGRIIEDTSHIHLLSKN